MTFGFLFSLSFFVIAFLWFPLFFFWPFSSQSAIALLLVVVGVYYDEDDDDNDADGSENSTSQSSLFSFVLPTVPFLVPFNFLC